MVYYYEGEDVENVWFIDSSCLNYMFNFCLLFRELDTL